VALSRQKLIVRGAHILTSFIPLASVIRLTVKHSWSSTLDSSQRMFTNCLRLLSSALPLFLQRCAMISFVLFISCSSFTHFSKIILARSTACSALGR